MALFYKLLSNWYVSDAVMSGKFVKGTQNLNEQLFQTLYR